MSDTSKSSPLSTSTGDDNRKKKFHQKTRNGCFSCRRRRVRCDEKRPVCSGCKRNELECKYPDDGRAPIDVRRLDSGQVIIIQHKAVSRSNLLPPHFDSAKISFFIENSLPLLSSFGPPPTAADPSPTLFVDKSGCTPFGNAFARFDRMWRLLVLPAAYSEPDIFELLSNYGSRHKAALTESEVISQPPEYSRMVATMKHIVRNRQPYLAIIGAIILFAYERLQSAATGAMPADQNTVHWRALNNIQDDSPQGKAAKEYLLPITQSIDPIMSYFRTQAQEPPLQHTKIFIPEMFGDASQARDVFYDIIRNAGSRPLTRTLLDQWHLAMLHTHDTVRGIDWPQSKQILTMLSEYQLLKTIFELTEAPI